METLQDTGTIKYLWNRNLKLNFTCVLHDRNPDNSGPWGLEIKCVPGYWELTTLGNGDEVG